MLLLLWLFGGQCLALFPYFYLFICFYLGFSSLFCRFYFFPGIRFIYSILNFFDLGLVCLSLTSVMRFSCFFFDLWFWFYFYLFICSFASFICLIQIFFLVLFYILFYLSFFCCFFLFRTARVSRFIFSNFFKFLLVILSFSL